MPQITFIGLGNMGAPMAKNLIAAEYSVCLYDQQASTLNEFEALTDKHSNIRIARNLKEAVQGSEVIITMLPAGKHVRSVYLGEKDSPSGNGLLQELPSNSLVIDSSTIDIPSINAVAKEAQKNQIQILDAPVSGGIAAAKAGTLTFMCGGSTTAFEHAKPILLSMGKNVFRAGDIGAGQTAKMCNNMLLAIHMIGTAEALQLGAKNGLDPKVLSEIMLKSSGANWSLEKYNPAPGVMDGVPASNQYKPGFTVELMLKDLGLAIENGVATGASTPLGALARNLYDSHAQQTGEDSETNLKRDFSSIWTMLNGA